MNDVIYWLWLSTSPRIGPRAITSLLKYYGSPKEMYFAPVGEITRLLPRNIEGAEELEKRDLDEAKRIFEKCDNTGIDVVTMNEDIYPERLRNIHLPPAVIYVKGKLPDIDAEPAIAVIGTRKATPYGIKMGMRMGYEIAKCGATVISGLTMGIDSAAAEGALLADGRVIGVLGLPHELDKSRFSQDVVMRGALVSEYAPGYEALRFVFQGKKSHNERTVARSCSRRSAAQERNTPFRKRGGRSRQGDIRRSGKCRSAQLRGNEPSDKRRRKACHKRLGGSQRVCRALSRKG